MTGWAAVRRRRGALAAGIVLPLALWHTAASALSMPVLLPPPLTVLRGVVAILTDPAVAAQVGGTALRVVAAVFFAWLGAVPLGMWAARRPAVGAFLEPTVAAMRSTPFISIILVALVWFSSGTVPIFVAFLMCFPLLFEAARDGAGRVAAELLEMAGVFRLGKWRRVRHLYLPAARPSLFSGLRSTTGIAWKVVVAAEVLSQPTAGLGTRINESRLFLLTESVLAWTVVLVLCGWLSDRLILLWQRQGDPLRRRSASGRAVTDAATPVVPVEPSSGGFIRFDRVSFAWPATEILREFTLELRGGEVCAVMGPSGIGKSTLVHLAVGLQNPTGGTVESAASVAVAFQQPRLVPWRTVRENLLIAGCDRRWIDYWLAALGLGADHHRVPTALSGGMQQRVALARALAVGGNAVVLDEPLSGLDPAHRAAVARTIRQELVRRRATGLVVTHDMELALTIADRVLVVAQRPLRVILDLPLNRPHDAVGAAGPGLPPDEARRSLAAVLDALHVAQ